MDREKVIMELKAARLFFEMGSNRADGVVGNLGCKSGIKYIDDALELLKEQEWNLLTEDDDGIIHGLPGDDGQYLMTDGKDIWIDDYVDGVDDGIMLDSGRDIREITAWMYRPELPKLDRR